MGANPAAGCNNKEEYAGVLPLAPGGVTPPVAPEAAKAATAAKGECNICPTDPGAFAEDTDEGAFCQFFVRWGCAKSISESGNCFSKLEVSDS